MLPDLLLALVFAVHLGAFAYLGFRRRQLYYLALVLTFALLTAAFLLRALAPDLEWLGAPLHLIVRRAAWLAAAVSLSWGLVRWRRRSLAVSSQ